MREIYTEIEIHASAEKTWEILMNFELYPDWNPFIKKISGKAEAGQKIEVFMQLPGGKSMTFKPEVREINPNQEFKWLGHLFIPGLFDGEHTFKIESLSENKIRFIHKEKLKGILVPLLWRSLNSPTKNGFEGMNRALKSIAEE
jgi:hypothetical protein